MNVMIVSQYEDGIMRPNPCTDLRYPKEKKYEASWYTIDQINLLLKEILNTTDPEFFAGILFAIFYANRRGEICGKRWSDISFEENKVFVTETRVRIGDEIVKGAKNEASTAAMPLMPFMREVLTSLKKRQEEFEAMYGQYYEKNDYIIKWPNGRPYGLDFLNYKLTKIEKKLGLHHVTLHGLRHSAGTLLRFLGHQQSDIQSWLRHGDAKSTQIYVHDTYEFKIPTAEHLDTIFNERLDIERVLSTLDKTEAGR
ncbi:site-specific integrase [Christensenellaceae bacterium OttesenSCG-928-L17]|nr:site-specific integrase [Christensenellaceae bacterium OttesenSCG-928-L17]